MKKNFFVVLTIPRADAGLRRLAEMKRSWYSISKTMCRLNVNPRHGFLHGSHEFHGRRMRR